MENNNKTHLYKLQKELLSRASSNSYLATFSVFTSALVTSIIFWDIADNQMLLLWMFFLTSILIVRTVQTKKFLQNKSLKTLQKSENSFKILALSAGLILTNGFNFILPKADSLHQAFILMILSGLSAGAVMSLSYYKKTTISYLMILLFPTIYFLYEKSTNIYIATSALVLLFFVMLSIFSIKNNKIITSIIKSKYLLEEANEEIKTSHDLFYSVFKQASIGLFTYNTDFIITEINQVFCDVLKTPMDKIANLDMKTVPDQRIFPALNAILQHEHGFYEGPYETMFSKELFHIHMKTVPLYDTNQNLKGGLCIVNDITKLSSFTTLWLPNLKSIKAIA